MHRQKYGVGFYRGLYARRYSAPTILDMNMSKHNKNLDEREAAIKQINKFVFRFIPFQDQSPIWPECLFIIGPKESETHSGKMIRYNDCENLSRYRMSDNKIPNIVCIPTTLEEAISYNGKSKGFAELENLVYMSPEAKIPIEQRKETGGSVVICPIVDKTTSLVSMRKNQDKHGRNVKAQDSFARKAGNSFWYAQNLQKRYSDKVNIQSYRLPIDRMYTAPSIERSGKTTFLPIEHAYDILAASDRGDLSTKWQAEMLKHKNNNKNSNKTDRNGNRIENKNRRAIATPIENACLMVLSSEWSPTRHLDEFAEPAKNRFLQKKRLFLKAETKWKNEKSSNYQHIKTDYKRSLK